MDRAFLGYYEEELSHVRTLAGEFAALHPAVARNLALDAIPCPDPYVERLLEGVAYLAARTRLKIDAESSRYVLNLLSALYPDLAGPAPAMSLVRLQPGAQVAAMPNGHVVKRGTRLVAGLREGLTTRATYTTAQDVTLWPVRLEAVDYLQDAGSLKSAGLGDGQTHGGEAALRLVLAAEGPGQLSELALDRLDVFLGGRSRGGRLFDAVFGWGRRVFARPVGSGGPFLATEPPRLVGTGDGEGLLPRLRPSFEGYRLIREYFLMPERFHYLRLAGLRRVVASCVGAPLEIVVVFDRARPGLADVTLEDLALFVTPLVNLFERECNIVELDRRRARHIVHADRARPRDFEIYRIVRVEDADAQGPEAAIPPLYSLDQPSGGGHVYSTERRPRRPGEDELRRRQMRTGYPGDDMFISVASAGPGGTGSVRRLDIRALCTNRDLPILDDTPELTLEAGDPVEAVQLLAPFRRPRESLVAELPQGPGADARSDALSWRLIAQLSLDHLSLAENARDAGPLRAMLELYADRGDPGLARHARSIARVASTPVLSRLPAGGPICFGHGTAITLDIDEAVLSGGSTLLLSALLAQLFTRYAAINSFVRTRTRLTQQQEDVEWPMTLGIRAPI